MAVLLKADRVSRTLPLEVPVRLVRDASLDVAAGEFVSITGPSGSGKSSLLYLLGLLDKPTEGRILLEGLDTNDLSEDQVAALRLEKLGFIFQSHFLLPEFTALENVAMPMRRFGRLPERQIRDRALAILTDLGLGEHAHKVPRQLSGGQSQRVAIGRALANDPLLILADEPTGNLDTHSSATVQKILKDLAHTQNRAVITVTHDMDFAEKADRRIHIVDGKISALP